MQGREKEAVIISMVRSNDKVRSRAGKLLFGGVFYSAFGLT